MVAKYMEEIKRVNEDLEFFEYMSAEEDNRKIENSIRQEMTERGLKEGLEKGMKKGMKKGIQQGMKQGIQQGIQQGLKQGIEQGQIKAKKETAKLMLEKGLDISLISDCTGLSFQEIEML